MKRIARGLMMAVLCTMPFWGAEAYTRGIHVNYSTTAAATYRDGTPILDGERFLLVWFKPDVEIDLSKDIAGDKDSFIGEDWWWVSEADAVNGCCPAHTWSLTSKYTNYKSGYVQLYLLDTRISSTSLAPMVKNRRNQDFPSVVNAVVPITGATVSWSSFSTSAHTISGSAPEMSAWVNTVFKPVPVIFSLAQVDGIWAVGVTNTLSTQDYVLKKASDPKFANVLWTSTQTNGAEFITTPLVIEDKSPVVPSAFYRIEVL